jgi:peptide deformylase
MLEEMYSHEGVGLAAPQVGKSVRLVLVDVSSGESKSALRVMINPVVTSMSPETDVRPEGCLSLPGELFHVRRSLSVKVRYLNPRLSTVEDELFDMEARIFLHELDHLSGILISDIGTRATFRPREDR